MLRKVCYSSFDGWKKFQDNDQNRILTVAHRTFGQTKTDEAPREPVTFDIAYEENIACRDRVNGKLLIELVGKVDSGNVSDQSRGILQVFNVCVKNEDGENPEDFTGKPLEEHSRREIADAAEDGVEPGVDPTSSLGRLLAVLDDPDTAITVDELAEMVGWLVENYTARPTQNAGNSSPGAGNSNRSSRRRQRRAAGTGAELSSVQQ
jgi:hypothetical protein